MRERRRNNKNNTTTTTIITIKTMTTLTLSRDVEDGCSTYIGFAAGHYGFATTRRPGVPGKGLGTARRLGFRISADGMLIFKSKNFNVKHNYRRRLSHRYNSRPGRTSRRILVNFLLRVVDLK